MNIISLAKSCHACPSQWEGFTDTGDYIYIRYRWGWLTASIGGPMGECVYQEQHGGEYAGVMDTQTMLGHLKEAGVIEVTR